MNKMESTMETVLNGMNHHELLITSRFVVHVNMNNLMEAIVGIKMVMIVVIELDVTLQCHLLVLVEQEQPLNMMLERPRAQTQV